MFPPFPFHVNPRFHVNAQVQAYMPHVHDTRTFHLSICIYITYPELKFSVVMLINVRACVCACVCVCVRVCVRV